MNKQELLNKVDQILENEGTKTEKLSTKDEFEKFILPGLNNSKSTLAALYSYSPKQKSGLIGKLKNLILPRFRNLVLNIVERESMRQQKFNELTTIAIEKLIAENQILVENYKLISSRDNLSTSKKL